MTDRFEKRGKKGLLFTIGDEPVLPRLPASAQRAIMGGGQYSDETAVELLDKARERYRVFHLHMLQGANGRNEHVKGGWRQLMGDDVIFVQRKEDVAQAIADKALEELVGETKAPEPTKKADAPAPAPKEEMML